MRTVTDTVTIVLITEPAATTLRMSTEMESVITVPITAADIAAIIQIPTATDTVTTGTVTVMETVAADTMAADTTDKR